MKAETQFILNLMQNKKEIRKFQLAYDRLCNEDEAVKRKFVELDDYIFCHYDFYDKSGNKISNENGGFYALKDDDFDRYSDLVVKEGYKRGLTNKDGNYTAKTDTGARLRKLELKIAEFNCDLLPDNGEYEPLKKAVLERNYTVIHDMVETFMNIKL